MNEDDLKSRGPIIYITPVKGKEGSFMCSMKKNDNVSEDESVCETIAMGMMKLALTDPSYIYDLGLEAMEEEEALNTEINTTQKKIVATNGKDDNAKIVDILDYIKFKSEDGKLN